MIDGRYVVLGLALARSPWFRSVASWVQSGALPLEFVKCASPAEVRAHLAGGRRFSALIVDGGIQALDRDLVGRASEAGCAVLVVDDVRILRDWQALGAAAVINPVFDRQDLLDVLAEHAQEIRRAADVPGDEPMPVTAPPPSAAAVAMVCGAGGTGTSTVAIALAQGLGTLAPYQGRVLLADLALRGDQAMLHDVRDVVPGVQELVDAHRISRPPLEDLHTFTYGIEARGYQLLLGLRRARDWPAIRPRAFATAFDSLVRGWRAVVCDADAHLEGERESGSIDVEERHVMSRTAAQRCDVVFAVGTTGMKGLHSTVRVLGDLLDHEVPSERIVPVFTRAPKAARGRAELAAGVAALLQGRAEASTLPSPIFLPERRVDEALRDGVRLPSSLVDPVAAAFAGVLSRVGRRGGAPAEPVRITPGSLGRWAGSETH